ncbi:MAG: TonB-dependent receptor, partial [Candidatus Acidiferrales bacterium]
MRRLLVFSAVSLVVVLALGYARAAAAGAQYQIHGRVLDPSGAVVAGASVTLFNQGRTPVRTVETNTFGEFYLEELPAGSYEVVARAAGMEPRSAAVSVPVSSQKPLELRLSLSSLRSTVTVTPGRGEVSNTFDVAGQVNVVGSETLSRRPAVILPQMLREEVGVMVQQTSAHQGAVVVRGLTGQQVLHLVDGVRLNNSTFRPGPNQYFALVDPNFVERVEVVRGPSSAQYGSDSLGGAVNVLPLRLYPEATDRRFHGEFMPFFRSTDVAGGSRLRLSYGTEKWSVVGGLSGARAQDMRAGAGGDSHAAVTRFLGLPSDVLGERLQDTAFTEWAGFARFYWKPAETQHLTASYLRSEQRGGRRYDQLNGGNGNLLNSFDPQILDFFYLRYEKQQLGWLDSLSGTFSYNSQRDDRTEQGGSGNPLASINDEFNDVDALGYQVQATAHIGTRQSVVFGGEIYDEYIDSTRIRIDPATGSRTAVRPRFPDESRYTTFGVFYQHAVELVPGRLRLNGGLRYSAINFRTFADANLSDAMGNPLVPDFSTKLQDLTFNVGASLRVTSNLDLFGTVRRGFRAPNAADFSSVGLSSNGFEISPQQGQAGGGEVGSTADATALTTGQSVGGLSPEVLYNYEMGLRVRGRRMTASVSGFVNDISDFITKRTLILPPGAVGETIGGQTIVSQLAS